MNRKTKNFAGITLTESIVSVAIVAMLIAVGIPAVRILEDSLNSSGAKSMISGALAAARAIAAQNQRYAGIRFQSDPNGNQYMIFIIHDSTLSAYGFCAVQGLHPVKLPQGLGVMDLQIDKQSIDSYANPDSEIEDPNGLIDTCTFSIIFSPSGKLVIHDVRVQGVGAADGIFNDRSEYDALFQQDSDSTWPFQKESSRNNFIIYDRNIFSNIAPDTRWTGYLKDLKPIYINPYTGTIIE